MGELIRKLIKWIPSNVGALIGVLQAVVSFIKECTIVFGRVLAPIIPGDIDDVWVKRVVKVTGYILEGLEKIKNFLV